jgi:hypothetical protein
MFGALIRPQHRTDTVELREKIMAFYHHAGKHGKLAHVRPAAWRPKQIKRMAARAGLEPRDATVPMDIFEDYESGDYHADQQGMRYSEEEVRCELTAAGAIPIECWFFVGGRFRLWHEEMREFHIVVTLDGDPVKEIAKADFLRSIGSAFDSETEARRR